MSERDGVGKKGMLVLAGLGVVATLLACLGSFYVNAHSNNIEHRYGVLSWLISQAIFVPAHDLKLLHQAQILRTGGLRYAVNTDVLIRWWYARRVITSSTATDALRTYTCRRYGKIKYNLSCRHARVV